MTNQERLLAAVRSQPVDHVPLTVRFWARPQHSRATWTDQRGRLAFFAERGWDTYIEAWCHVRPSPDVRAEVFHETDSGGKVLRQVWHTPAGDITERLRVTDDWPEAASATAPVGLLHDFRPSRYLEVPFKTEADLAALPYLLPIHNQVDEDSLLATCRDCRSLGNEFHVPVFLDIRSGLDWLVWLHPGVPKVPGIRQLVVVPASSRLPGGHFAPRTPGRPSPRRWAGSIASRCP